MKSFLLLTTEWHTHIDEPLSHPLEDIRSCLENPFGQFPFPKTLAEFLNDKEILHHYEHRLYKRVSDKSSSEQTIFHMLEAIFVHVYDDNSAFEARLHLNASPLHDGWEAEFAAGDYSRLRYA